VGVVQQEAKTVLAYSSISQMGFLIVGLGLGLGAPQAWPAVAAGIALYAMHHGLAKGALFLGVGVAPLAGLRGRRLLVTAALLLPALSLAGAPFTSGALAKISLKPYLDLAPSFWPRWGTLLLSLAAVGTTILMGRFFWLLREQRRRGDPPDRAMLASWGVLVAASLLLPWVGAASAESIEKALAFGEFWSALWPVGAGAVLIGVAGYLLREAGWSLNIPPGDLLVGLEKLWQWLSPRLFRQGGFVGRADRGKREYPDPSLFLATAEKRLLGWPLVGTLFLLLIVLQALLLAFF
ncbi:MAG: NADH/ubiquinone/plastoquinone (complex I), partial [Desulfuromonadales bacterium]|nr:NADH/ubiquinone/plastoquinone (complex I) [Desulfuromonadales bacterium]